MLYEGQLERTLESWEQGLKKLINTQELPYNKLNYALYKYAFEAIQLKLKWKQYKSHEISRYVITFQVNKIRHSITELKKILAPPKLFAKGLVETALEDARMLLNVPRPYRPIQIKSILKILNDAVKKSEP